VGAEPAGKSDGIVTRIASVSKIARNNENLDLVLHAIIDTYCRILIAFSIERTRMI
jgi:hypothetical protein